MKSALASVLLLAALPAAAQYREGTPPVLTPAPKHDPQAAMRDDTAFRAAYAKAGSPRITVFWNRQLTDATTTQYDQVQQASVQTSAARVTEVSPSGRAVGTVQQTAAVATVREGERALPDAGAERSLLSERSEWPIASAFSSRLQRAGVQLVDRTMALRSQAAGTSAGERRDVQAMEIKALQGKSDLLAEVLQAADPRAPFGVIFRVDIKDVDTGALVASVVSDGKPPEQGPGRYVAGRNGFVREAAPGPTLADIGDVVAHATLQTLAARWR
jgi:hypothetical protein